MNRPGLSRISYRAGDFTSFRQKLFEKINQAPALQSWTYRGSDDPGVALLEAHAMVADVLTAYQEVFANESFLRTAQWEKNVTGLTRLLGERPHPGTGGHAYFSLEIRKGAEISLRKGFPLISDLEEFEEPVQWESVHELTLIPELSQLKLEWPKKYLFPTGAFSAEGVKKDLSCAVSDFKDGLPSLKMFVAQDSDAALVSWPTAESEKIKGEITSILSTTQEGPRWILKDVKIKNLDEKEEPRRALLLGASHSGNSTYHGLASEIGSTVDHVFAFDGVDSSIVPGDSVLLKIAEADYRIRRVEQVRVTPKTSLTNVTTIHTLVVLDQAIYSSASTGGALPLGGLLLWKIKSPWFKITAKDPAFISPAAEVQPVEYLVYRGGEPGATALKHRKVGFISEEGRAEVVTLTLEDAEENLYKLSPKLSDAFTYADFIPSQSKVLGMGNILEVSQGKSEPETVIGSGDSRETHQTFAIPKAPLTYYPSPDDPSKLIPELQIWVQGRLWTQVESFLEKNSDAEVYIVREDLEGKSWVQFGDGLQGARLPTGADNVTAAFRFGVGAKGPLQRDTQPRAGEKIDRLEKMRQLGEAWGGKTAESPLSLKHTAPQKIRALGRLVSLDDYEAEVRKIPGVLQVQTSWGGIVGESQNLDFLVFADSEDPLLKAGIENTIRDLDRKGGLQRLNVKVSFGQRRDAYLAATLHYDSKLASKKDLDAAARLKLGVWDQNKAPQVSGLFSMDQRSFGQNEYRTRIQAVLQNMPGVRFVSIQNFGVYNKDALLPPLLDLGMSAQKSEALYKTSIDTMEWLALRADQTVLVWSDL